MLKPQDIVVLLKVYGLKREWTYSQLAKSLKMSSSEVHGALKRCSTSGLYNEKRRVSKPALSEFLVHGLKYVFPAQPGALVRGMPTAHSAQPLKELLVTSDRDIYVWAFGSGERLRVKKLNLYTVPYQKQCRQIRSYMKCWHL